MSWSTDERALSYADEIFTLQRCVISESLRCYGGEKSVSP